MPSHSLCDLASWPYLLQTQLLFLKSGVFLFHSLTFTFTCTSIFIFFSWMIYIHPHAHIYHMALLRLHRKGNNHDFVWFYMITEALCHCTNVASGSLHMIMNVCHCNLHIQYYISFFRLNKVSDLSCTSFRV